MNIIQKRYYDFPYYKQMLKENLDQTVSTLVDKFIAVENNYKQEEDYEEERCDATEWATGEVCIHMYVHT